MKFNLTITDMTEEEFANVFRAVHTPTGDQSVTETVEVSNSDTPETDTDGLHWDARIHSSNHKINSDGRWQRRRGVSDAEYEKVKAELLGVVLAPVTLAVDNSFTPQVVAPAPVAPVVPEPVIYAPTPAPAAPVAPEPTPAPAAPEPVINADTLYQTMFQKLQVGLANQTLKPNDIQNILNGINITFGASYTTIAAIKGNVDALQYAINELVTRGL